MKRSVRVFHWMPRILCFLAIPFISMFAMDAFEDGQSLWQQLLGFFMHLIPTFILIAFFIIAWKWELIGGIIFSVIGLGLSPFIFIMNYHMNHNFWMSFFIILMITFPFLVIGILFMISHYMKKKHLAGA
jgi:hypothetical protein